MESISYFAALVQGVVEGLTEFVPVSSTGHLIVVGSLLGMEGPKSETFEIFIQLGAILAVVVLYFQRYWELIRPPNQISSGLAGWAGIWRIAAACFPVCLVGAFFGSKIKSFMFTTSWVAAALLFGGIVMWLVERFRPPTKTERLDDLSLRQCFLIGVFQCCALWPGMSRSASTIVGGLILGLNRKVAAEFSFIIAAPVMTAAVGYDLLKSYHNLSLADVPSFALGFVVAFVTALFAVKALINFLSRYTLVSFGVYRIALSILLLCFF